MSHVHLRRPLSRRTLLRGAAGVGLALPLLHAMEARGQPVIGPKRFVVMFSPNGTVPKKWGPPPGSKPTEYEWELGEILEPLTPWKHKLVLVDRLDMESAHYGPGDSHMKGMAHILTGTEIEQGSIFRTREVRSGWGGGISIDQLLAKRIGGDSHFKSLHSGVKVEGSSVWTRMSYSKPGSPVAPENNPRSLFDRVFAPLTQTAEERARIRARRQSVLDYVRGDFARLNAQLGAADRMKLEAHLTTVRELESRLLAADQLFATTCASPERPMKADVLEDEHYPEVGARQMDLIATALACDLTRVATLQWSHAVGVVTFPWLGIRDRHHDLSHYSPDDPKAQKKLTLINHWFAQQFAYLIEKLDSIPEGDGTVLDNSIVVWVNELASGPDHDKRDIPILIAGGGGGALRTGRYVDAKNAPHNNLWVSVLNAFGFDDRNFGNPKYCKGPLKGLL